MKGCGLGWWQSQGSHIKQPAGERASTCPVGRTSKRTMRWQLAFSQTQTDLRSALLGIKHWMMKPRPSVPRMPMSMNCSDGKCGEPRLVGRRQRRRGCGCAYRRMPALRADLSSRTPLHVSTIGEGSQGLSRQGRHGAVQAEAPRASSPPACPPHPAGSPQRWGCRRCRRGPGTAPGRGPGRAPSGPPPSLDMVKEGRVWVQRRGSV